jgi:hypothetical protein
MIAVVPESGLMTTFVRWKDNNRWAYNPVRLDIPFVLQNLPLALKAGLFVLILTILGQSVGKALSCGRAEFAGYRNEFTSSKRAAIPKPMIKVLSHGLIWLEADFPGWGLVAETASASATG